MRCRSVPMYRTGMLALMSTSFHSASRISTTAASRFGWPEAASSKHASRVGGRLIERGNLARLAQQQDKRRRARRLRGRNWRALRLHAHDLDEFNFTRLDECKELRELSCVGRRIKHRHTAVWLQDTRRLRDREPDRFFVLSPLFLAIRRSAMNDDLALPWRARTLE